jgi:hypothetical protein
MKKQVTTASHCAAPLSQGRLLSLKTTPVAPSAQARPSWGGVLRALQVGVHLHEVPEKRGNSGLVCCCPASAAVPLAAALARHFAGREGSWGEGRHTCARSTFSVSTSLPLPCTLGAGRNASSTSAADTSGTSRPCRESCTDGMLHTLHTQRRC